MHRTLVLTLVLLLPTGSALAIDGNSALEIKAIAEVEVKVKTADGKEEIKRAPATKVEPGHAVIYTIFAKNRGDKPATDVVVTDPVPQHMDYVDGSLHGDTARVTFSVDGGKTFAAKEKLQVTGADGKPRAALPEDFTHIRWAFEKALAPGESRAVGFRARVE